jgi:hypothetical protein
MISPGSGGEVWRKSNVDDVDSFVRNSRIIKAIVITFLPIILIATKLTASWVSP